MVPVLLFVLLAAVLPPQQAVRNHDAITDIAAVVGMSVEEAARARPVRLRGVVTFTKTAYDGSPHVLFIQEGSAGIFVVHLGLDTPVRSGDLVEIRGKTDPGDFGRMVYSSEMIVLGRADMPKVAADRIEELLTGRLNGRWVSVELVIRRVVAGFGGTLEAIASVGDDRFRLVLPHVEGETLPTHLEGATALVHGVLGVNVNLHRQLVGIKLFVPGLPFIDVLETGIGNPGSEALRPIKSLLVYSEDDQPYGPVRIRGTVTKRHGSDKLFLADSSGSVRVHAVEDVSHVVRGDVVDAVGYATSGGIAPFMQDATVRRIGSALAPEAEERSAIDVLRSHAEAVLVRVQGVLLDAMRQGDDYVFTLQSDSLVFQAILDGEHAVRSTFERGSTLSLTGVVQLVADPLQFPQDLTFDREARAYRAHSMRLLLRDHSDIAVIARPAWLTPRKAMNVVLGLVALILLSGIWVTVLRRRVHQQTKTIREHLDEVQRLKENAESLNEAKSRFFADISHEFRTPLTLILGPLRAILDGATPRREELDVVHRNAQRLLHLIDQLLELSRLDAHAVELNVQTYDLVRFVRERVALFESVAEVKGIQISLEHEREETWARFDADKIEKVLVNLVSNAVKFTPPGGRIVVRVQQEEDQAGFEVWDSGVGIPRDELAFIFERFHRVADDSTNRRPGTGIGLALCRELAELHGGAIQVESRETEWTRFSVKLGPGSLVDRFADDIVRINAMPDVTADAFVLASPSRSVDVYEPVEDARETDNRPLVLVVEDDPDLRSYLRRHLTEYQVKDAVDGANGIDVALEIIPDLILTDLMMPHVNGFTLCTTLKENERTSHIPIILLSARADVESKLEGLGTGADDYLPKPFDADELRVRVRNLIDQRRRLRAAFSKDVLVLGASESTLPEKETDFLRRVHDIVEENRSNASFGVDFLAESVHMSRRQLTRKLNALIGEPPGALIRRIRLEYAAILLRRGEMSIHEIADSVGYRSAAHFSTIFSEAFGMPPSEFGDASP